MFQSEWTNEQFNISGHLVKQALQQTVVSQRMHCSSQNFGDYSDASIAQK